MSLPRTETEKQYIYDHEKYNENKIQCSPNGVYKSAAVACDSVGGSAVGKQILEKDGSIVDAAIATLLCNSLLNAQSMGIGGGFFMLHYSKKDEKMTVIDSRETAPALSSPDMFKASSKTKGGLSVAVPGEIKGYWKAHQMFGKMKWEELFKPAIEMCNNGFNLPPSQAKILKFCESKILDSKPLRETFVNSINNQLYKAHSVIKMPKLARTFEIIAKEGESAFYNGQLTDIIVDEIQSAGGIITKSDLQTYDCVLKEPVSFKLKNNLELYSIPSPSSGLLVNFILAILDNFDHDEFSLDFNDTNSLFMHRFIEACKYSFGFRCLIGDETSNHSSNLNKLLTDKKIINEYKSQIKDNGIHPINVYGSPNFVVDHGTAHTSIIAPNGDAVAITSSINLVFGSKVMGDRTNIIYNNQMDDFSCPDGDYNSFSLPNYSINYIKPGKRPASSMTPLIALDENKNVRLTCGSSGGTRIITSTAMTAAKHLLLNKDIVQSVDDPRVHHQLWPDEVLYEEELDPDVVEGLSNRGHRLVNFGRGGSAVQAIARLPDGRLHAVSDYRKGGAPSGF